MYIIWTYYINRTHNGTRKVMKNKELGSDWENNLKNMHASMAALRKSKKAVILEHRNGISVENRWGSTVNEIKSYLKNDKDNDMVLKQYVLLCLII